MLSALDRQGVQTGIHYPVPVHLRLLRDLGYKRGDFPQSEKAADEVFSLPLYPEMTDDQIESVSEALMGLAATR